MTTYFEMLVPSCLPQREETQKMHLWHLHQVSKFRMPQHNSSGVLRRCACGRW